MTIAKSAATPWRAHARPPTPLDSSSVFVQTSRSPATPPAAAIASAATTIAAIPPFMSHEPRPLTRPSETCAWNGSCSQPSSRARRHDVDVPVEQERAPAARPGEPGRELRAPLEADPAVRAERVPGHVLRGSAPRPPPRRPRRAAARRGTPAARPRRAPASPAPRGSSCRTRSGRTAARRARRSGRRSSRRAAARRRQEAWACARRMTPSARPAAWLGVRAPVPSRQANGIRPDASERTPCRPTSGVGESRCRRPGDRGPCPRALRRGRPRGARGPALRRRAPARRAARLPRRAAPTRSPPRRSPPSPPSGATSSSPRSRPASASLDVVSGLRHRRVRRRRAGRPSVTPSPASTSLPSSSSVGVPCACSASSSSPCSARRLPLGAHRVDDPDRQRTSSFDGSS